MKSQTQPRGDRCTDINRHPTSNVFVVVSVRLFLSLMVSLLHFSSSPSLPPEVSYQDELSMQSGIEAQVSYQAEVSTQSGIEALGLADPEAFRVSLEALAAPFDV